MSEEFGGPDVTVVFEGSDGPQRMVRGELTLRDTSYGIATPKGYRTLLAGRIADRISNEMREATL